MPDLACFQADFARALTSDEQPVLPFRSQAFAVYRNTSARGAVEALRAAYPTVDMLVGDEMFTQVALDYRAEQPPAGPVLSEYGRDFAGFLELQPWASGLPYLADVARLDRLWLESFLARDAAATPQSIIGSTRVLLHPAARFAWLATPAVSIWLAHRGQDGIVELEPEWIEEGALFTRPGLTVRTEQIDPAYCHLLRACMAPARVADAVAAVAAAFPEADVPGLLQRAVSSGALCIQ
jgi:hypothetical protein